MQRLEELKLLITKAISTYKTDYQPYELYEPIHYSLSMGGKRIRPLLVLLGADLFDGEINKAIPSAVAIEVFHNFTLVHDDIMDDAPMRRGKETVFFKWGLNRSILSGDTMFAMACRHLADHEPDILGSLLKVFTDTAREVCEGQQLDMNFETHNKVSLCDYLEMIRLKTAVLLGCSLKMGALISKANPKDAENLYHFGVELGLAFQIMDDLLDSFGDEAVFGKRTGGDILGCKKTYLYLKALELANAETRMNLESIYHDKTMPADKKINEVKNIFLELRVQDMADSEVARYHHQAMEYLDKIPVPESKKGDLKKLANMMISRTS